MTASSPTIFLSYASQDAEAARRIRDALNEAGLDVWFDENELRGGDSWDASIRKQVRECALFVPLISANTDARSEGYFRREWNLAVQRMLDMAEDRPFLLPVVIDETAEAAARVPERFRERQWSRVTDVASANAFAARVVQVASGCHARAKEQGPAVGAPPLALPDRPSIVVLPFRNLGDDVDQDHFTDGVVEEITTALSRFQWLFVIARNSASVYKERGVDGKRAAAELGVQYVLEGSVRKAGSAVRINARLIDAISDAHIWADRMDGQLEDIFALQDAVAAAVVSAVVPKVQQSEIRRVLSRPQHSLTAYEAYFRGVALHLETTRDANARALEYFMEATRIDPRFALAYARAARCFQLRRVHGWMEDRELETAEACRLAHRALELGRDDPLVMGVAGYVLAYICGEFDLGADYVDRSVALNPNFAEGWALSGWVSVFRGEYDKALEQIGKAVRLSPFDPDGWRCEWFMGLAHFYARRFEEASQCLAKVVAARPRLIVALRVFAAANGFLGNREKAQWAVSQLLELEPNASISGALRDIGPRPKMLEHRSVIGEGLRLAGLPE